MSEADFRRHQAPRTGSSRSCAFRRGSARAVGPGLPGRPPSGRLARGRGGADAGDVRAGVPELAVVHARNEPSRVAAAHPHEPQHRSRPAQAARAADDVARREGRLLPLRQARGGGGPAARRGARDRAAVAGLDRRGARRRCRTTSATCSSSSTSATSATRTRRRSSTSRSARSCRDCIARGVS